ncbi:hypothetical protein GLP30_13470 [Photobacterium phosphoreum]|uniref:Uncharacterized protein n=1 Tax=Photobacterium phosphoreum TaxID=659 RepID=A0AAW4ZU42_PHOPO|nr:hypothetical protein [Photobacterium phosphoreum]MCD9491729.1 hypothetical protein [Photobacterium phosphoreum]MCF2191096.1 hypothetical protein [Photobacterium phosphoreum]MCF2302638.1 hypothetical protein [Photobacterium phosphoreum]
MTEEAVESQLKPKWVFQALVLSKDDIIGYLAYSLYKFKKDELATFLRKSGVLEPQIKQRLHDFHDNALVSQNTLNEYRDLAEKILLNINNNTEKEIKKQLEKNNIKNNIKNKKLFKNSMLSVSNKERDIERIIENRVNAEIDKIKSAAHTYQKPALFIRFLIWIRDGFSGVFATSILILLFYAYAGLIADDDTRKNLKQGVIKEFADLVSENPLPSRPSNIVLSK